jgi:hypothetical protein
MIHSNRRIIKKAAYHQKRCLYNMSQQEGYIHSLSSSVMNVYMYMNRCLIAYRIYSK